MLCVKRVITSKLYCMLPGLRLRGAVRVSSGRWAYGVVLHDENWKMLRRSTEAEAKTFRLVSVRLAAESKPLEDASALTSLMVLFPLLYLLQKQKNVHGPVDDGAA